MKDFVLREIWLPVDVNGSGEPLELAGGSPLIFKGAECMIRLALFDRMPRSQTEPGEFRNVSSIALFEFKIRSGSYAGTLLLNSTSGGFVDKDATCTETEFFNKSKAPINILLPAAITSIAAGNQYFTLTGQTVEKSDIDAFGRGRIVIEDIGIGAADSAVPASPTAPSKEYVDAVLAQCVKYGKNPRAKTATFVSRNGKHGRTIGCDDNGQQLSNRESYS